MLERLLRTYPLIALSTHGHDWAFQVGLELKLADLWVGAYPHFTAIGEGHWSIDLWVCVLPCLPLHVVYIRRDRGWLST